MQESSTERTSLLDRRLSGFGAVLLTISAITPASSVFIIIPGVIAAAGTGVIYSLALAALVGVVMALTYGELTSALPSAGGEYVIVRLTLGALPSFVTLVLNGTVMVLISSVLAVGAGDYIERLVPFSPAVSGLAMIAIATLIGLLNIRLTAVVTGVFLLIELTCILATSAFGFAHVVQPLAVLFDARSLAPGGALVPTSAMTILLASAVAVFSFNGYEQAVYLTEEVVAVRRRIAGVIIGSLALTLVLETAPTVALFLSAPRLSATLGSATPFLDMVVRVAGSRAGVVASAAIALAVFNACIVNILMTARFIHSTGRDAIWGGSVDNALARISHGGRTPWLSTLVTGTVAGAVCFVPLNILLVLTGTGLLAVYNLLCLALIAGRRSGATVRAGFRSPAAPALQLLGIAGLLGIFFANWLDPGVGRASVLFTIGEIAAAVVAYLLVFRARMRRLPVLVEPE